MTTARRIVVTGGAGFIGSCLLRQLFAETDWTLVCLDKLTYAGNLASLGPLTASPRFHLAHQDIGDLDATRALLARVQPDAIMHLAAESHVDRSISGPGEFVQTNLVGTFRLLDAAREYWTGLPAARRTQFRFHHISTDEVLSARWTFRCLFGGHCLCA